ncbi:MAG: Fe-Mn family superoxide dismutase [Vampirovibrionales bacterium]|nr:Fe-Mn family superoxide dismutase [Vampirovibrionales bacterium]
MTTMAPPKPYVATTYDLQNLDGISGPQLDLHYKLYQGYVANTNTLSDNLRELAVQGKIGTPVYNEQKRRLGFEFAGMRMHEFYFGAMTPNGGALDENTRLGKAIVEAYGSVRAWEDDFKATGMMRGIGWAMLLQDPVTKRLQNFWITDHENGHPPAFNPIVVMDVWEHAYMADYGTNRKDYIEAYFKNICWKVTSNRLL